MNAHGYHYKRSLIHITAISLYSAVQMESPKTEKNVALSQMRDSNPLLSSHKRASSCENSCLEKVFHHRICLRSKAVALILLWNVIVGIIYGTLQCAVMATSTRLKGKSPVEKAQIIVGGFVGIALIQMTLFPLGGLMADIWQGRYRIVYLSFIKITLGFICLIPLAISNHYSNSLAWLVCFPVIFLSLGFAGFQSNAVQFGLDQLKDAPSEKLSVFLHWYVWTSYIGQITARLVGSVAISNDRVSNNLRYVPIPFAAISLLLLLVSCFKHRWCHCEPKSTNPYGTVYRVLQFAARHRYPLLRSAHTYCGDMNPTRLDYANTLLGGPFPIEVVEDVKTFFRMLVMLLLICPVFFLEMSSDTLRPLYGLYIGSGGDMTNSMVRWVIFKSGNLSHFVSVLIVPFYIVFIFPKATRLFPRMLHRMLIGVVLLVFSVAVMGALYAAAIQTSSPSEEPRNNRTNYTCLFYSKIKSEDTVVGALKLNILYLMIPDVLTGIARPIIHVSILEFTSAQSPYPMKGLLLGTFYATRGMYNLMGCLTIYFFTVDEFKFRQKYFDCGFIYYSVNIVIGLLCLPIFVKAIRWYQYRKREGTPYDHRYVEYYYSRYMSRSKYTSSVEEKTRELPCSYESMGYSQK